MAALTFLQLVNRVRRECGVSGTELTTLQSGLTTEQTRFKDWVADAWTDIQLAKQDWLWMRTTFSFNTVAGTQTYAPAAAGVTDLGDWVRGSFRCYTTSVGSGDEQILPFMDWQTWRNVYQFGTMRSTQTRPVVLTVMPDRSLATGPVPDGVYTIVGEYIRAPSELSADADTVVNTDNSLPERFQMLVVYRAMKAFATFSTAPELLDRATREERRLMQQLTAYGVPTITSGPPLA